MNTFKYTHEYTDSCHMHGNVPRICDMDSCHGFVPWIRAMDSCHGFVTWIPEAYWNIDL